MPFKNKNILILSPQGWDDQHLSKHHYAIEFAKMGNNVLFVAIPEGKIGCQYGVKVPISALPNLMIAQYRLLLPFWTSFHIPNLYKKINLWQVKRLIKHQFGKLNLIIDFGHYRMFDNLTEIEAEKKIFFPVDDSEKLKPNSRGADICLSVSTVIVEKFKSFGIPCYFINHGLSENFVNLGRGILEDMSIGKNTSNDTVRLKVGYSGNLLIPFLNRTLFRSIVEKFQNLEFHCFGRFESDNMNSEQKNWITELKKYNNVYIHGILNTEQLCVNFKKMNLFWLCYEPDNKNYHSENSHKVLEYLSTGKAIVSTPLTIYEKQNLLEIASIQDFQSKFENVTQNLKSFNAPEKQTKRIQFALENSYQNQIERIYSLLY